MERCKFKIGDFVRIRGTLASDQVERTFGDRETRFIVITRLADECMGGIQFWYECRPINRTGDCANKLIRLSEIEIEACKSFAEDEAERKAKEGGKDA